MASSGWLGSLIGYNGFIPDVAKSLKRKDAAFSLFMLAAPGRTVWNPLILRLPYASLRVTLRIECSKRPVNIESLRVYGSSPPGGGVGSVVCLSTKAS